MSKDFKGGGKRNFDKKPSSHSSGGGGGGGEEGKDGVEAWSLNSVEDFALDQALLAAARLKAAQAGEGAAVDDAEAANASSVPATAPASAADSSSSSSSSSSSATPAQHFVPTHSLLYVDGSVLEGGGQVLRNAMAYSSLLSTPIHVHAIRAGRPSGGGLKSQHLKGVELAHEIVGGKLKDAGIGAREITFHPGSGDFKQLRNPTVEFADPSKPTLSWTCDIVTAGAIGLLIQTSLPIALFMPHPVTLTLKGGTNASMAPVFDYTQLVFGPLIQKFFGVNVQFELIQRGFFPRGGGIVKVHTQPVQTLKPINVTTRGDIVKITGLAFVTSRLPQHIADRMMTSAYKVLHKEMRNVTVEIESKVAPEKESPIGDGVCIILLAHTSTGSILASSALGEKGKAAEDVGTKCAEQLLLNVQTGGVVDEYMQDQLILFMALASGTSTLKTGPLTLHTRTCLFWAQYFTGCEINVVKAKGDSTLHTPEKSDTDQTFLIQIKGIGYKSRFKPH